MRIEHYRTLNKLTSNYGVLEDLIKIYRIKSHDYFLRDLRQGKHVSLYTPRIQEDRALYVVTNWRKSKMIKGIGMAMISKYVSVK